MKRATKVWLIVAACLMLAGLLLSAGALAALGLDFTKLTTVNVQSNTYTITDAFNSLQIDTQTANVKFFLSDDGTCRVVCKETEKVKHTVAVEDGTLKISVVDDRQWYDHIGIFLGNQSVEVFLPETEYNSLYVSSKTGNVEMQDTFSFESAVVETDTGNVKWYAPVARHLQIESDTGNVRLKSTQAVSNIMVQTATGNVYLDRVDGAVISVKTATGNVTGSVLGDKIFQTESATGDITTPTEQQISPGAAAPGKCIVETETGNIKLEYAQ